MKNDYQCIFDIDFKNGDVEIRISGDGQSVKFRFMIAFFSIPWFFGMLLLLWSGKRNEYEIDGFGFAEKYHLTVEQNNLLIEHLTDYQNPQFFYENGTYSHYHYKFNFQQFIEAVDQGFSNYLHEQALKGRPINVDETSFPLSSQVIEEFYAFSTAINTR